MMDYSMINTVRRVTALGVTLTLAMASLSMAQPASDAEAGAELLRRVQENYDAADGLRATFTQQTRSPFTEDTVAFEGTLLLQGAKYRITTQQQTLVTDGTTTWIYNPVTSQVIINQYVNDETIITPDEIFTDYLERYTIEAARQIEQSGTSFTEIDLAAEEASAFYANATVRIRRSDAMLARVELEDQNGATTIFQLDNIQMNPSFDPGAFLFSPPPDAEVVDLRS